MHTGFPGTGQSRPGPLHFPDPGETSQWTEIDDSNDGMSPEGTGRLIR